MKHCPKISLSIRNAKTLQTSTGTILIGQCHMMSNAISTPTTVVTSVFQSDNSLSHGKHACPMDPSIGSIGQSDFATINKHAACTHP